MLQASESPARRCVTARRRSFSGIPFLIGAAAWGCSTSSTSSNRGAAGSSANGQGGAHLDSSVPGSGGPGATGGIGSIQVDAAISDVAISSDATCAGAIIEARRTPLDLFIMLDQSTSMTAMIGAGRTRWSAVTGAITNFVRQPEADGIGIGINYFGYSLLNCTRGPIRCTKDSDCLATCGPCGMFETGTTNLVCKGLFLDLCDSALYAKAEVPIAQLPGNVQPIIDSMAMHSPSAGTPTSAALKGSLDFCETWATDHPEHAVVNVLATDGQPEACDTNAANIRAIAAQGLANARSIRTFVIGVGADIIGDAGAAAQTLLNGVAAAGGTTQAFFVSDRDLDQQFLGALNQIRGGALACSYSIPDTMGRQPDYRMVNVRYTPAGVPPSTLVPKVANQADCGNRDGWYYDNDTQPTRIIVCDATCQTFSHDAKGKVEIEVGCVTVIAPPR